MILQNKAVLVNFTGRCWSARKYDKSVSRKVENIYGAIDAGRYNKVLVQLDKVNEIAKFHQEFRRYHYAMTVPWLNNLGLLPSEHIFEYSKKAREYREKHDELVKEFLDEYPQLVEDAKLSLNKMYKDSDYPSLGSLREKFEFDISTQPVPSTNDFRINLQEDEIVRLKEEYAKCEQEALANGMNKVWKRMFDAVSHIVERLSEYNRGTKKKSRFHDTIIGNVTELVGLLPALNIVDDPKLEEMRRELEQKICTIDPHNLRNDAKLRDNTISVAKDLIDRMGGFAS